MHPCTSCSAPYRTATHCDGLMAVWTPGLHAPLYRRPCDDLSPTLHRIQARLAACPRALSLAPPCVAAHAAQPPRPTAAGPTRPRWPSYRVPRWPRRWNPRWPRRRDLPAHPRSTPPSPIIRPSQAAATGSCHAIARWDIHSFAAVAHPANGLQWSPSLATRRPRCTKVRRPFVCWMREFLWFHPYLLRWYL